MSSSPISWKQQWVVAVTKGRKTRYFYGEKLAGAMRAAGVKKGDGFAYARFLRGPVRWGEAAGGDRYVEHGLMRARKAA